MLASSAKTFAQLSNTTMRSRGTSAHLHGTVTNRERRVGETAAKAHMHISKSPGCTSMPARAGNIRLLQTKDGSRLQTRKDGPR